MHVRARQPGPGEWYEGPLFLSAREHGAARGSDSAAGRPTASGRNTTTSAASQQQPGQQQSGAASAPRGRPAARAARRRPATPTPRGISASSSRALVLLEACLASGLQPYVS